MLWKFSAPFTSQSNFVLGCTLCARWDLMWFAGRSAHQQEAAGVSIAVPNSPPPMSGVMKAPSRLWGHSWARRPHLDTLTPTGLPAPLGWRLGGGVVTKSQPPCTHSLLQPQFRLPLPPTHPPTISLPGPSLLQYASPSAHSFNGSALPLDQAQTPGCPPFPRG